MPSELSSYLPTPITSSTMSSQVTLIDDSNPTSKGQVRLLYKRRDQQNAALLEDNIPKYFLTTSDDGFSQVKIRNGAQQIVGEVNRRVIFNDTLTLAQRNDGRPMKAIDIIKEVASHEV